MNGVQFGDLLAYPLRSGVTIPAGNRGNGIKMLNMGELFRYPRVPAVEMARVEIQGYDADRTLLQPHDLLFARRSLTLEGAGKCAIVDEVDEPTTWEGSILRARMDPAMAHAPYYFYYFSSPQGRRNIETIVEQVAAAGIRGSDLKKLTVPHPDLEEQHAIAEVLGALDDKIAANTKLVALIDAHMSLEYTAAVLDSASVLPLNEVAEFQNRKRVPLSAREREQRPGDVPYYGASGVFGTVDTAIFDEPLVLVGEDGSVINSDGTPVCQYIWGPAWVNNHAHVLTGNGISTELLFLAIKRTQVATLVTGAVQPKINMGNLKKLMLDVPPVDRRDRLEQIVKAETASKRAAIEENRTLAAIRDVLLPQLMSGKLRVKDAEKVLENAGV